MMTNYYRLSLVELAAVSACTDVSFTARGGGRRLGLSGGAAAALALDDAAGAARRDPKIAARRRALGPPVGELPSRGEKPGPSGCAAQPSTRTNLLAAVIRFAFELPFVAIAMHGESCCQSAFVFFGLRSFVGSPSSSSDTSEASSSGGI